MAKTPTKEETDAEIRAKEAEIARVKKEEAAAAKANPALNPEGSTPVNRDFDPLAPPASGGGISDENAEFAKTVGGGPQPRYNPVPAETAHAATKAFHEAGESADIPNPDPQTPEILPVPPGPGATQAASMLAQNNQPPAAINEPINTTKPKEAAFNAGGTGVTRRVRHISEFPEGTYLGKVNMATGEPVSSLPTEETPPPPKP